VIEQTLGTKEKVPGTHKIFRWARRHTVNSMLSSLSITIIEEILLFPPLITAPLFNFKGSMNHLWI
jgi:hypothetical protein